MAKTGNIDASRLRERITIQKPMQGITPAGQLPGHARRQEYWEDVCTVWAEAKCIGSGFAEGDSLEQAEYDYKFCIRWREGIRADYRILWRGRAFQLVGPPVDWAGYRVGLTLHARELVTYGTPNS